MEQVLALRPKATDLLLGVVARHPGGSDAAIEVRANVAAQQGKRADAVQFLQEELATYKTTSIRARIQKNINMLSLEGKAVGMLTLARKKDLPYAGPAVRSAEIIGVQMASLLERARLYDEANRLYRDLKVSYDELGRKIAETNQLGLTRTFTYDSQGRLASVTLPRLLGRNRHTWHE